MVAFEQASRLSRVWVTEIERSFQTAPFPNSYCDKTRVLCTERLLFDWKVSQSTSLSYHESFLDSTLIPDIVQVASFWKRMKNLETNKLPKCILSEDAVRRRKLVLLADDDGWQQLFCLTSSKYHLLGDGRLPQSIAVHNFGHFESLKSAAKSFHGSRSEPDCDWRLEEVLELFDWNLVTKQLAVKWALKDWQVTEQPFVAISGHCTLSNHLAKSSQAR